MLTKTWIYIKKYWSYILIFLIGLFSLIWYILNFKAKKKQDQKNIINSFNLGNIKGKLEEKNKVTELELKALKDKDVNMRMKIDKIKKIKDEKSRRRMIDDLLKTIPIILLLILVSCTKQETDLRYPSFLPPKINTETYLEFDIDKIDYHIDNFDSPKFGRISFEKATIITLDGETIVLEGGFVFDDYETLKFIQYEHERTLYKKQLQLMIDAYNNLYDNAKLAENIWMNKLDDENSFIEKYNFEIGYSLGLTSCLGVLYSTDTIIKE